MIRSTSQEVMANGLPKVPIELSMRENPKQLEHCNDSAPRHLLEESNTLYLILYDVVSFERVDSGSEPTIPESSIIQSMV
jgi:hypothetical protein